MTFFIIIIRLKDMKEKWKVRSRGKSEEAFHIYVHVRNVQSTDVSLSPLSNFASTKQLKA